MPLVAHDTSVLLISVFSVTLST